MDASQVFVNLLRRIEDSKLNYSMSKTPFSATISLKSSFLKRFASASQISDSKDLETLSRKDFQLEEKVTELKAENFKLQTEIDKLQNTFDNDVKRQMGELLTIQKMYDEEKEKSNVFELRIAELREEALIIKKEKKDLNTNFKMVNEKCDALKIEAKILREKNESLKSEVKVKNGALVLKNAEILETQKEIDTVKKDLIKMKAEKEDLKNSELKQNKIVITCDKCDKCDLTFINYVELKMHNTQYHSHNKASQYETIRNFELFNCFYCEVTIDSEVSLEDHYLTCQNGLATLMQSPVMYEESNSFPCEICDARCRDSYDLQRHWTTYHCGEKVHDLGRSEHFQCDICPLIYNKKLDLEFHKRGYHWS